MARKSRSLDSADHRLVIEALDDLHQALDVAAGDLGEATGRAAAAAVLRQRDAVEELRADVAGAKRVVLVLDDDVEE